MQGGVHGQQDERAGGLGVQRVDGDIPVREGVVVSHGRVEAVRQERGRVLRHQGEGHGSRPRSDTEPHVDRSD